MIPTLVIVCALAALWVLFEQATQLKRQAERIVYLTKAKAYAQWRAGYLRGLLEDMHEKMMCMEEELEEVTT